MSVVLDASLLIALALNDPRAAAVDAKLRELETEGETFHAPSLLRYEAANALARSVVAGHLAGERVEEAWERILAIGLTLHPLEDGALAVAIALRLKRSSAYDAAYIALAQVLGAELWTLDGPLARNAGGLGFPVRLVESD